MGQKFAELAALASKVESDGACSLPGCSFDFNVFVPIMQRAVVRGFVPLASAQFVARGLWHGFLCGVDVSQMRGRRVFRNYPTSYEAADKVTEAVSKRVAAFKTMCLGAFDVNMKRLIPFDVFAIFPMGAVKKKLEDAARPVDDHTRTLLNMASDLSGLRFGLKTHKEVAAIFFKFFSMSVKDVSDAFPLIPLHPSLWPFMLFQWFSVAENAVPTDWCLYVHIFAGFGMAGLPGVWKILFQDVLLGMARSEQQLTLPVPVFVDDAAIIGADPQQVDAEAASLAAFLLFLGVVMKDIKTRYAATLQLYIGLWWNSVTRTLELEQFKLDAYLAVFQDVASLHVMTLREAQSIAGKMQRCALTFPPGSECVFASLYTFMRGLVLPWQKRRVSRGLKADVAWGVEMLRANLGRGYFSYDLFEWAPPVWTDASKSPRYTGGGYVLATGQYCYFRYGTSAARKPIDELEGDVVVRMVEQEGGEHWRGRMVPLYIDNSAFQLSGVKGWSKADRLNVLLKELFKYSVHFGCIFHFFWISTHENVLADALSRPDGLRIFLEHPRLREFVLPDAPLRAHAVCGCIMRLRGGGQGSKGFPFQLTVSYTRASVFVGLPDDGVARQLDQALDNRLGSSSHRSVRAALGHWDTLRARHGWARIIATDDVTRGGKLATFLMYFVHDTELSYASISNYIWGLRTWMKFQRQIDPAYGIVEWADATAAVEVITFVAAEPRKEVPGSWILGACTHADKTTFKDVQNVLLQLFLLNTFSRSESPLAQSYTGAGAFDPMKNLQVQDIKVETVAGVVCVGVRLKAIKQDAQLQRPEAQGDGDWVWIADAEGPCGVLQWLRLFFSFFDGRRSPLSPFFVAHDLRHAGEAYLYNHALTDARGLWARAPGVSADQAKTCGLHGLRVAGHNGTSRVLGKAVSKVQGGWSSDKSQTRYDRSDLVDIVRIPGAIVSSWASREVDFDFAAIQPLADDEARPAVVPAVRAVSAPVERGVAPQAVRNVHVTQPYASSCSMVVAAPADPGVARSSSSLDAAQVALPGPRQPPLPRRVRRADGVSHLPAPSPPAPPPPPPHSCVQRRVTDSQHLALTRPQRASRLVGVDRFPAGAPGLWRSAT